MRSTTTKKSTAATRTLRSDGVETRSHVLQTAGNLFSSKGYARTTSKEICQAAGTNMAAVNYHFGGKEGLYGAVLADAHAQLVQLADLERIQRADLNHRQKLRALIGLFLRRSTDPSLSWGLSVLVHEFMAPSRHMPAVLQSAVLPKIQVMKGLISEILSLPKNHAAVQRSLGFVILPCIMMVIAPRPLIGSLLPELVADADHFAEDMTTYALAGLIAIKMDHKKRIKSKY